MEKLLEFYGRECPHCHTMEPLVAKLEAEEKIEVERYEVWHNERNAELMRRFDTGMCGGVPFFFNTKSGHFICGAVDYGALKEWAIEGQ